MMSYELYVLARKKGYGFSTSNPKIDNIPYDASNHLLHTAALLVLHRNHAVTADSTFLHYAATHDLSGYIPPPIKKTILVCIFSTSLFLLATD